MIRRIITIDTEKCNGCGLCADACHEGAVGIVDGKAKLLREDYCDGLGDCLPACPVNAISFAEREAPAYNEEAVLAAEKAKKASSPCCRTDSANRGIPNTGAASEAEISSRLANFPVQIKLVPVNAPWFENADVLIAADCTAYAYGDFHNRFMRKKVTLIGCSKLDSVDYAEKLTQIFKNNNIRSVIIARMTVPCCGGLSHAVATAIKQSGKSVPLSIITIRPDGQIVI